MATMTNDFYVALPNRGLIRVSGADRAAFLQNLISNDINLLQSQDSLYACFLTPQGKFQHDFFITVEDESFLLECEGGARAENLLKAMKPYKIRTKVDLACEPAVEVFALLSGSEGYADPRHPAMGRRSFTRPAGLEEKPFAAWDEHRIRLGIPDGSRDMEIGADTLLECNIDKFNGLSFEKGCYIGQEITARMHLRGLVKKHLYAVLAPGVAPGADIHINGKFAGTMRSSCNGAGLAMLKDELVPELKDSPVSLL